MIDINSPVQNKAQDATPIQQNVHAVIHFKGKVLLLLRAESPQWFLPGGKKEATDASLTDAMFRELEEETRYVKNKTVHLEPNPMGEVNYQNSQGKQKQVFFFKGDATRRNVFLDGSEEVAFKWFSPDNLPENLPDEHRAVIWDSYDFDGKTCKNYERGKSSKQLFNTIDADSIHGLGKWLRNHDVQAMMRDNKVDFPLHKVPGIGPHLEKHLPVKTFKLYTKNYPDIVLTSEDGSDTTRTRKCPARPKDSRKTSSNVPQ